ncbi:pentatricopeptide repeat-containing protein DOT4, chloroplastic [Momordica charantia]|uniref:Pentatricopeptide repeat-containing protein DOT4, chloroplastic n=1 Tax=Momordica charantia TaxID=3673 RepID=A0A6J1CE34_MOMCH|nr:pentatricopeptide repeat-containing protein DOT4, chloroplastic [Momordica charantia]
MLLVAKSPPTFWLSPTGHDRHGLVNLKFSHSFVFAKPKSKFSFSNSAYACTQIYPSPSQTKSYLDIELDNSARIVEFCEVGDLKNAMELLCSSGNANLDLETYCSVLQLCAERKSIRYGKRVHSIIESNGVVMDGILGAKLVFMYVKCGDLKEARMIFDKLSEQKVFLWNLMISEYAGNGNYVESVNLFKRMMELGIKPNSYTFSSVLKCLAAVARVEQGRLVHGFICKLGFSSYNTVVNSLISFYFVSKKVRSAQKLFDELSDRDVISWNSMISGYVKNGLEDKGIEIFIKMLDFSVDVDLATMVNVLVACANTGTLLLGKALHSYAIKAASSLDREVMFKNTLLDMYSKCGDLNSAIRVFEKMDEKTVVSWTSMIAGYVREGLSDGAIELFDEMKSRGVVPDVYAVTSILHACAINGNLSSGKIVHNYIRKNNLETNSFVSNALMDMYAKCGSMKDAQSVFSHMKGKDVISWNTMIGGYSKNHLPNEALNLFAEMQRESKPDGTTVACILPACASLAALDRGREIHGYALRNGYSKDKYVVNALVDMYVKCGLLVLARSLFDMILDKDLVSWTVMIAGYGMHGFGNEAVDIFNQMRISGVEPDEVSFISILYACSHSGLLDEGWKFFNIMKKECRIEPKLEHYACMVDLLARTGNLVKAHKFIKTMPIEPDATIWGALLCGCRIHHDVKVAEKVAERIFELEPENTGYYVLLANIYAEAEKWEEVQKLRKKIGQRGLKKNPGCSWIEIKGKVNIFVAGDCSKPQAKKIELLLKKLRSKMKEEGYSPKTRYALLNADEREKEVALCGHSEKLAMAFGMLNLPPGKTIRVTKNLRVCGDCHEMAKFMSKNTTREIVLRDSNRFHHFKDGYCSCRGYW